MSDNSAGMTVRIRREDSGNKKSGFEIEKRADGFYYGK